MKYTEFTIKNFKGIKNVTLNLRPEGAAIYALIGLNESGKTTILEAIHHHSKDVDSLNALYGTEQGSLRKRSAEQLSNLIPKGEKSDFSDVISIEAGFVLDPKEKEEIARQIEAQFKCVVDRGSIPDEPALTRKYRFEDSDFKNHRSEWNMRIQYRSKQAKKWKAVGDEDDLWLEFARLLNDRIPQIAFFTTFLFDQPERIYLTEHDGETGSNRLYRQIIENIAASLPKPLDIQRHLVDRLINEETFVDGVLSKVGLSKSKQQQITATQNEISAHLTKTVFDSWSKTFGSDFGGREIILSVDVEQKDDSDPLAYATFEIKDEGGQYEIKERSLGFRWFFSFILFTLFGVNRSPKKSTLFLLDEPASNLHSRAQMQLLESFLRITKAGNQIIYSTHSHYMIKPEWLDQAFIVSNSAIDYDQAYQNDNVGSRTEIGAISYKRFVGENPDRPTYFQPVLDKLDVTLSDFDLTRNSVLVEGKGDFRVLEYGLREFVADRGDFAVIPTRGATGMDELIGLFLGWSVPFVICLDDEAEGRKAAKRYREEWGLGDDVVLTLADIDGGLAGKSVEGFLSVDDRKLVASHFGATTAKKGQVGLFFAEKLATGEKLPLSSSFQQKIRAFNDKVVSAFG